MPDGQRSRGKLETVSLTGGLLSMSNMLDRGSHIKLMFLTQTGPVLGAAEMLSPVSTTRQPFRFVALEEGDQRRLRTVIQSSLNQNPGQNPVEQAWIAKYRAAVAHRNPPQRGVFGIVLGALTLLTLCLGSAVYLLHVHLLK
jgi:alpha-beta hydrolase superfamily lysophospholipase